MPRSSIVSINSNKPMNYLLQTVFKRKYELIPVEDVFQAMHQVKTKENVRLMIVDVDFDTLKCWDLIQHIKTSQLFSMPVVVLTTHNTEDFRAKCYETGVDEIFFKPFDPADLLNTVSEVMAETIYNN